MRAARESLGDAWQDMRAAWRAGGSAAGGSVPVLQQRVLLFAQSRVQTFRDALSEFVAGYSQGAQEVRSCRLCTGTCMRSITCHIARVAALYGAQQECVSAVQVESGKVDVVQDSKRFWTEMMHTLPAFLDAPLDARARHRASQSAQASPRSAGDAR